MKARKVMRRWKRDVQPFFTDLDGHLVRVLSKLNKLHTQCQMRRIDFDETEREIKGIMNHASAISDEAASLQVSLGIIHSELFSEGLPYWREPEVAEVIDIIHPISVIAQEAGANSEVIEVIEE
jgi:hypothetical protein